MVEELLVLAEDCTDDPAVLAALRSAIIGSTEMAGLLSRWDRYYLKSYESMAGHRFNFTTLSVEPNVWGMPASGRGTTLRRLLRLVKASEWLQNETKKSALSTLGPTKAASQLDPVFADELSPADVMVVVGSSERQLLPTGSAHLVLTDPPYHDDVQYGELSRPLRAWAGLPSGDDVGDAVVNRSTQNLTEAGEYSSLLSRIFRESARTLREDGHLIFSYANRSPDAWIDLIEALHSAGLQAVGCEILHSENETDNAKRGVRACSLDLILDLVPKTNLSVEPYYPRGESSVEGDFLRIVAHYVLQIGNLKDGWKSDFRAEAGSAEFLAKI
jgi:adenine-specific DNA methylase